ncbi:MAG: WS/DGAT domain-containing protein, partial [Nevskia sp.]|nr:WS/DGAT domain-containing protein [Nevskia sp.]
AGALRQYLTEKDELPERPLVAAVPISVRSREDRKAGGNRVAVLTAELPTHYADPLQRVAAVSRSTAKLKRVHRAVPAKLLMDWMELPTPALMARAARLYENFINSDRLKPPVNVLISNVPGPPHTLYLAGAPLLANYPLSIPYHGLALNITVLSYRDQLDVGLTAYRDAVPDVGHLLDLMVRALEQLEHAAGVAPARGRAAPSPRKAARALKSEKKHAH